MHRHILIAFSLLALTPWLAKAQETPSPRAMANAFFGGGALIGDGRAGYMQVGVGGEGRIYKGFGAGSEIGYLFPREGFTYGIGLLSTNATYHFWGRSRVIPFVTGGYSLAFREGMANLANFGGGVDVRFHKRMALRFEVRDHVWPGYTTTHFLMFRVGMVGF